jgi:hypothetical protein
MKAGFAAGLHLRFSTGGFWESEWLRNDRRDVSSERHNLAAAKLLSDDDLLGRVNAVNLEHVLGYIQTDRGNLHVDGSLHMIRL